MVKEGDCWAKPLITASGLPRLYSRHHCISGSTIARTPIGFGHTGICCVALVCILRDSLAPVLLGWASPGAKTKAKRPGGPAAARVGRRMIYPRKLIGAAA